MFSFNNNKKKYGYELGGFEIMRSFNPACKIEEYDNNIIFLDISDQNLSGILDLIKFFKLEELNCSNNNIEEIKNIPLTVKKIICYGSSPKISKFPDDLEEFSYGTCPEYTDYNYYSHSILNISNIPQKVKVLNCACSNISKFNDSLSELTIIQFNCSRCQLVNLNKLPNLLEILNCSYNQIVELNNLPNSLKILNCSFNRIVELNNLPNSLEKLDCSSGQIVELNNLPYSLEKLNCSYNQIVNLNNLPNSLKVLNCKKNKILKLNDLPNSLEELDCSVNLIQNLNNLPNSLKILNCRNTLTDSLNSIPINLEFLNCCDYQIFPVDKFANLQINVDLIEKEKLNQIIIENYSKYKFKDYI